jgi:hypothetical protein
MFTGYGSDNIHYRNHNLVGVHTVLRWRAKKKSRSSLGRLPHTKGAGRLRPGGRASRLLRCNVPTHMDLQRVGRYEACPVADRASEAMLQNHPRFCDWARLGGRWRERVVELTDARGPSDDISVVGPAERRGSGCCDDAVADIYSR